MLMFIKKFKKDNMIKLFSYQRFYLLLFILCIGISNAYAQSTGPLEVLDDADTMAIHESMTPSPADAQLNTQEQQEISDSLKKIGIAFMRLREVIALKKDILWSTDLCQTIKDFEDSTFIVVEPLVKVQGRGALIGIVSLLGQITIGEPEAPYVKVFWIITPVTEQGESFKLTVDLDYSDTLPESMMTAAKESMSRYYLNKVYQEVEDTETDILNAMDAFLSSLGTAAGDHYAPKYLLQIDETNYRSGFTIELFEQYESEDSLIEIHLVDRITEERIEDSITWEGATYELYGHAEISKNTPKLYTITATRNGIPYTINIQIMSDDLLEVVLSGMQSVLDEALTDVMQLLADSAAAREEEYQNKREISAAMRTQMKNKISEASGLGETIPFTSGYTIDSTAIVSEPVAVPIKTNTFLGQYINKAQVEHFARMAFIFAWENRKTLVFMTNSANREAFKQAVLDDIGKLAANLIVQYATGNRDEMKAFLIEFILEKVTVATQNRLTAQ
jgi:hypothetical protein